MQCETWKCYTTRIGYYVVAFVQLPRMVVCESYAQDKFKKRQKLAIPLNAATTRAPFSVTDLRRLYNDSDCATDDFMELFSPPRLVPLFLAENKITSISADLLTGWNLADSKIQGFLFTLLKKRAPRVIMLCPPCTVFSIFQHLNKAKRDPVAWETKWSNGLKLLDFAMRVAKIQVKAKRIFIFEHPVSASSWTQRCVQEVLSMPRVGKATFDQCRFHLRGGCGGLHQKRTTFMSNSQFVLDKFDKMYCSRDHKHEVIQGSFHGESRALAASRYPPELCDAIVQASLKEM